MLYLTPARFRTMNFGADLTGIDDAELISILSGATLSVNRYCNAPMLPQAYDFRGGTISGEKHTFQNRRIFLRHRPVKAVTSMRLLVTNSQYLQVNPTYIFVGQTGWVELYEASLTSIGLWGAAMMPGIGLQDTISETTYTYGYDFPVTSEEMAQVDTAVWQAQSQFWDEDEDMTIYVDGVERTTNLTLDPYEGTVTFTSSVPAGSAVITADYTHHLPPELARATGLIATSSLAERDLFSKGLGNLAEIQVEEVRLRRDARRSGTVVAADAVPNAAVVLLDAFRFVTVM